MNTEQKQAETTSKLVPVPEMDVVSDLLLGDESYRDNLLIHGDNLPAMNALSAPFAGRIKCIYIDPPYNCGNPHQHYHDDREHVLWLSMMEERLQVMKGFLAPDGILAVQIDDHEYARLFLLLADIFGENNLKTICVKMAEPTGVKMAQTIRAGAIPKLKEYIILASPGGIRGLHLERIPKERWDPEYKTCIEGVTREELDELKAIIASPYRSGPDLERADEICGRFVLRPASECLREEGVVNAEEKEAWLYANAWRIVRSCSTTAGAKRLADARRQQVNGNAFTVVTPAGKMYVILRHYDPTQSQPRIKLLFADDYLTVHPGDFWGDIKTTGLGREGGVDFTRGKKPEMLLKRIIGMCTSPGDWVMDAFAGSGTTGAVAHKMRRRWIMIESGDQCLTHIVPRMERVIRGTDKTGITSAVSWGGGGGFRFFQSV